MNFPKTKHVASTCALYAEVSFFLSRLELQISRLGAETSTATKTWAVKKRMLPSMNYWLVHIGINLYFGSTTRFKTQTPMFFVHCWSLFSIVQLACFPPKRPRSACHVVPHPWARIPLSKDHLPTANYPSPKFAWPSRPILGSRHVNMTRIRHASIIHPVFGKCNKVFLWCKRWKNDTNMTRWSHTFND